MRQINWETVGNVTGKLCNVVGYGLLLLASRKMVDYAIDDYANVFAGYSNAINAIMNSDMYSHDKCEAAEIVKRKEDCEYYKAIIHVANDRYLYSHDKVDLIKGLSEH